MVITIMKINNIGYLLKEGIRGIFLHGFMSFAAVCVTVVVTYRVVGTDVVAVSGIFVTDDFVVAGFAVVGWVTVCVTGFSVALTVVDFAV